MSNIGLFWSNEKERKLFKDLKEKQKKTIEFLFFQFFKSWAEFMRGCLKSTGGVEASLDETWKAAVFDNFVPGPDL